MNGPYTTNLKLNSLNDLKDRLAVGTFTNGEILALVCEIETLHVELEEERAKISKLKHSASVISDIVWAHMDDSIDIDRLREEVDSIRHDISTAAQTDIIRIHKLLARILHKIDTDGSIVKTDGLVIDIHRYMYDADLLSRKL